MTKTFKKEPNHVRITNKNKNNNSPKKYSNSIINNTAIYTAMPYFGGCDNSY